jgi:hypothetical protein
MPDWVIWVAIGVLFMSWRRSRACCGVGVKRIRGHRERMQGRGRDRMTEGGMSVNRPQPRLAGGREEWLDGNARHRSLNGTLRANRRETPLEALQRKFVNGPMTLEQYEAELDQLDRLE